MSATDSLSAVQFGQGTPVALPSAHRAEPRQMGGEEHRSPLGLSGSLGNTAQRRIAWRLDDVQPYSKATMGSTFNPNA